MKQFVLLLYLLLAPFSASAYFLPIDLFEGGGLDPQWTVTAGNPADVSVVPSLSALYDGGFGPQDYFPPEGSGMLVLNGVAAFTQVSTSFTAYAGEMLNLQWFFATPNTPHFVPGFNDIGGLSINGSSIELIDSLGTGSGYGQEVSGWQSFVYPLQAGVTILDLWVVSPGVADAPRFAFDTIVITGQSGLDPRPEGTGGGSIPAPGTLALIGLGVVSLAGVRRRSRKELI